MTNSNARDFAGRAILFQNETGQEAFHWKDFESGPALVALVDGKGTLLRCSREWHRAFGFSYKNLMELAIPADRAILRSFFSDEHLGEITPLRFRHLLPDGSKHWYQLLTIAKGEAALVQVLDVTSVVKRERALRSAEKMGQMGSWAFDTGTGELTYSNGLLEIFGLPKGTDLGVKPDEGMFQGALRPEDFKIVKELIQSAAERGHSFDREFEIHVDGATKWIRVVGTPLEVDERILVVQGATQDITAQKNLESLADKQRELFEHTVDNIPGVVFQLVIDSRGGSEFTYMSRQVEQVLEFSPSFFNKGLESFFKIVLPEDADRICQNLKAAGENQAPISCEVRLILNRTKRVKWVHVRATPTRTADGIIVWDGILLDISNEKEIEAELKLARMEAMHTSRLATIGEMVGSIAHEVNTPLGAILLSAQSIQRRIGGSDLEEPITSQAQLIEKTVGRISKIVNSLRRLSRGRELDETQVTPAKVIIDNALALCMHQITLKSIDLRVDAIPDDLFLCCQEAQITQVLINLLVNARDAHASREGGSNSPLPWIHLSCTPHANWVELRVLDNGAGIDESLASRVFEPFFTTKGPGHGTGLGLSISRKIIEAHGGRLTLESSVGPTEFLIRLPRHVLASSKGDNTSSEIAS